MAISKYRVVERNQNLWYKLLRLEQAGLTIRQIAKMARIPFHKAQRALASPYYQQWKEDKANKRVSAFDREFAKQSSAMLDELSSLVPLAIQTYEEAMRAGLTNPALLNIARLAADSVLDRDSRFNKSQQVSHSLLIPQAELDKARKLARELREPINITPTQKVLDSKLLTE